MNDIDYDTNRQVRNAEIFERLIFLRAHDKVDGEWQFKRFEDALKLKLSLHKLAANEDGTTTFGFAMSNIKDGEENIVKAMEFNYIKANGDEPARIISLAYQSKDYFAKEYHLSDGTNKSQSQLDSYLYGEFESIQGKWGYSEYRENKTFSGSKEVPDVIKSALKNVMRTDRIVMGPTLGDNFHTETDKQIHWKVLKEAVAGSLSSEFISKAGDLWDGAKAEMKGDYEATYTGPYMDKVFAHAVETFDKTKGISKLNPDMVREIREVFDCVDCDEPKDHPEINWKDEKQVKAFLTTSLENTKAKTLHSVDEVFNNLDTIKVNRKKMIESSQPVKPTSKPLTIQERWAQKPAEDNVNKKDNKHTQSFKR